MEAPIPMLLVIALLASALILVQNLPIIGFAGKEGVFLPMFLPFAIEISLCWSGYAVAKLVRSSATAKRVSLLIWAGAIITISEGILPFSGFSVYLKEHANKHLLNQIHVVSNSLEMLAPHSTNESRFLLRYALEFPAEGGYATYPAFLGSPKNPWGYGKYFMKEHPEYHTGFNYKPGTPYEFAVIYQADLRKIDPVQDKAYIQIWVGEGYFMTGRHISFDLSDFIKQANREHRDDYPKEPSASPDSIWEYAEKNICVTDLTLEPKIKSQPVQFSFAITNQGGRDIPLLGRCLGNLVQVVLSCEPVSDDVQQTPKAAHAHIGSKFAVGNAMGTSKDYLLAREKVIMEDKIPAHLLPGVYRLHLSLRYFYATQETPIQDVVKEFSIVE